MERVQLSTVAIIGAGRVGLSPPWMVGTWLTRQVPEKGPEVARAGRQWAMSACSRPGTVGERV
jgi:hypothetical protein